MRFLQPLGLIGLIGVPIIIIIYLVKSRYTEKPVSSTFIWKRSLMYMKRRIPLSFVISLLLVLQILTVVVASLSMAKPIFTPFGSGEKIVIIDSSASMQTVEGDKSRFDLAKEKVSKMADKVKDNNRMTIILAGNEAKEVIRRSAEKIDVLYALEDLKCSLGTADMDGALKLANEVQEENAEAEIVLITDKTYETVSGLEVIDVSRPEEFNVGILSLDDKIVAGRYVYTAEIASYGKECETVISIFVDGKILNSKKITIPDSEPVNITFTPFASDDNSNTVLINSVSSYSEVKIALSGEDGIKEDNEFSLFSKEITRPKVMFVSNWLEKDNEGEIKLDKRTYIMSVLYSLGYMFTQDNVYNSADDIPTNSNGEIEGYDLYVFDGVMPESLPKDGAIVFFNPPSTPNGYSFTVKQQNEGLFTMSPSFDSGTDGYKILTKNIKSKNIVMNKYKEIEFSDSYEQIFMTVEDESPLIIAGKEGTTRVVTVAFDIHNSNLPSKAEFPLLIKNITEYLLPDVLSKRCYNIGETVQFYAPVGSEKISFIYNDTVLDETEATDTKFLLDELGTYEVKVKYLSDNEKTYKMPTHIPNEESDIKSVGDTMIAYDLPIDANVSKEKVEAWPYLIILLFILSIIEWGVYYKNEF